MVATLLSRPLGYVRVAIQAWLFGATATMDAFVLAFSVPSMLQVVLLTGPFKPALQQFVYPLPLGWGDCGWPCRMGCAVAHAPGWSRSCS